MFKIGDVVTVYSVARLEAEPYLAKIVHPANDKSDFVRVEVINSYQNETVLLRDLFPRQKFDEIRELWEHYCTAKNELREIQVILDKRQARLNQSKTDLYNRQIQLWRDME